MLWGLREGLGAGDFAEQGEKEFDVFDLVCSSPSGNLSWVPEHTAECVIKTTDHIPWLWLADWEAGNRREGKECWLHWTVGPETRGMRCGEQVPLSPFQVPKSSGFGVMISGSLRADPPGRLNPCLVANI